MVNNKVILIGRITRDAHVTLPKEEWQNKVAHVNLAVDKMRKRSDDTEQGGDKEESNAYFIRCTAFDKQASFLEQYGKKGVKFAVEGHLSIGSYKKDGVNIQTVEVIIENIQFCERKERPESGAVSEQFMEIPEELQEEMPFK